MKTFTDKELYASNVSAALTHFCDMARCLNCEEIFDDDFWKRYQIHAGSDGELHLYRVGDHGEVLFDERGELYATLIDLAVEIDPEFKNNWPERR